LVQIVILIELGVCGVDQIFENSGGYDHKIANLK
jgi:hypothetical protein